ncbi:MAG: CvpA family protein [Anaerolineae bacterium]|nr:CvpA family protein [Anaerolineae bacterium]
MEIDWMLLTYLVVGFFAVIGFFRGWWKEAITILFLAVLLLLLQRPDWAQVVVDFINWIIAVVWQFVVNLFGLTPTIGPFQFNASSPGTWIAILLLVLGFSAVFASLILPTSLRRLPSKVYKVGPLARILGLFLGAINGFLIISLVREYLDGRALPGNTPPETEIAVAGSSAFGPASTNISIQAVNLPQFTIMDSYIPWLIVGIGLLIFFIALRNRIIISTSKDGRKVEYKLPYGYKEWMIEEKKPDDKKKDEEKNKDKS